ncbi:MAG: hypothetical protein KDD04_06695, partial [Sinomicrobium sp.]|nr:hypothetical protein [Sinomicrobium sp.]
WKQTGEFFISRLLLITKCFVCNFTLKIIAIKVIRKISYPIHLQKISPSTRILRPASASGKFFKKICHSNPTLSNSRMVLASVSKEAIYNIKITNPMMPVTTFLVLTLAIIAVGKKAKAFR